MARMFSRRTRHRRRKFVPWLAISSAFHPPPMPKMNRPLESMSRLATSLAVVIGSRSIIKTDAGAQLEVGGSARGGGQSHKGVIGVPVVPGEGPRPRARGLCRLAGMWVCSGTHRDSKPRSSRRRAKSSGRMEIVCRKHHCAEFHGFLIFMGYCG